MATDDVFLADFSIEDPSGASTFGLAFQQQIDSSPSVVETDDLAEVLESELSDLIRNMISVEFWHPAIRVRKVSGNPVPMSERMVGANVGLAAGAGLPSNCALNLGLIQAKFSQKSNGRIFIAGVPEGNTTIGIVKPGYSDGPWKAFADRLPLAFDSISDTGRWFAGVISAKVLNAAPPAKDWEGAFAFITDSIRNPALAIQRRRTTKVFGTSTT